MSKVDTNDVFYVSEMFLQDIKKIEKKKDGRFDVTDDYLLALRKDVTFLLSGDTKVDDLLSAFKKAMSLPDIQKLVYSPSDVLTELRIPFKHGVPDFDPEEDLLYFGKFYYHPLLQVSGAKTRYVMKENHEIVEVESEPFYLELKPRFTMTDLIQWFIVKTNNSHPNLKGFRTQFHSMLPIYGLDMLLYMIEAACTPNDNGRNYFPKAPRFLEEDTYIEEAKRLYYQRIQMLKESDIYGIIPRSGRYCH
ncbi:hypothetical protein ACFC9N_11355 [Enterococcus casseliflavus]|uniref:hypothetical protein n=1 Tax=Enterococcus TaxID=1350 RepID=UPI000A3CADCC|nr:hypothetical protein [Enterococcus sp. 4E1_DIV0656]OTO09282.1 hypothetical protein A5882_003615 [Enterococcus sp. 4E1_DIV0656]